VSAVASRKLSQEILDPLLVDLGIKIDNSDEDQISGVSETIKTHKNKNRNDLDAINEEDDSEEQSPSSGEE
jgi:hypothetical protein